MSELFLRYLHTQRGRRIIPVQGIAAEFRGGGGGQRKGCPTAFGSETIYAEIATAREKVVGKKS